MLRVNIVAGQESEELLPSTLLPLLRPFQVYLEFDLFVGESQEKLLNSILGTWGRDAPADLSSTSVKLPDLQTSTSG